MAKRTLLAVLASWLLGMVACAPATPGSPTITFPTDVPVEPSPEPTPRITGACSLLVEADVEQVLGGDFQRASATPLTCGYALGARTVALTLQRAAAWDEFAASFAATGALVEVPGLGARAVYADATLGGVLMVEVSQEVYLLSGMGDLMAASDLMSRVLARLEEAPTAAPLD